MMTEKERKEQERIRVKGLFVSSQIGCSSCSRREEDEGGGEEDEGRSFDCHLIVI